MKLAGKTAIVTGGARGIGLGCATELAQEGAAIALVDRPGSEELAAGVATVRELGVECIGIEADIFSHGGCQAAVDETLSDFGDLDILVHVPAFNRRNSFLDYPPEVRRLIYTTNAIEALNSNIRRAVRTRGHFPSDDAAAKLIYLALNATSQEWKRSVREWHAVKSQFAIMFENRFPMA